MKPSWTMVRLGELGEFRNGVNFSRELAGEGLGLINVKDIFTDNPRIYFDKLDKVNLVERKGIEKYYVESGDLFFVRSSVKREGIGYVSYSPIDTNRVIHCGFVIRFRLTNQGVNPLYLVYLLRTPYYREKIINISSGAAITNISQTSLSTLKIELPPRDIQNRIANFLFLFDDLIEVNSKRIRILEEFVQSLHNEWFVRLNYPGYQNAEIVETPQGFMPKEWQTKNLGDISSIVMGQSPNSRYYNEDGQGLPFHQGVSDFGEIFPSTKRYSTKGNKIAEPGDILFSVRAPVGRINFAITKMILGRGLCGIRSKTGDQMFLYEQMKRIFREEDIMGGGTVFKAVTKKDMHNIKVIYPKRALLDEFEGISKPIFDQIEILSNKNRILRKIRDLVSSYIFSGGFELDRLHIDTSGD